jgi:hypothetical protein
MTSVRRSFDDLLNHPQVRPLDSDWVDAYRSKHDRQPTPAPGVAPEIYGPKLQLTARETYPPSMTIKRCFAREDAT